MEQDGIGSQIIKEGMGILLDPMSHRYTMRVLLDNSETIELYGDEFDFENK